MNNKAKELTNNIIAQIYELAELTGVSMKEQVNNTIHKIEKKKDMTGATGGLRFLKDEKYFDSPRQLPETIERLKQEGRHYSNATISMGLLALVRERLLTRFREKGDNNWKYVIRK